MILKGALTLLISLATTPVAYAEKMDLTTHTLVIEKLENVRQSLDDKNPSLIDISLRLADVYAERARLLILNDNEKDSKTDRESALKLYQSSFKKASTSQKG